MTEPKRIDITPENPFFINGKAVAYFTVKDISFRKLSDIFIAASRSVNPAKDITRRQIAERLVAHTAEGHEIKFTDDLTVTIPAFYGSNIVKAVESFTGVPGEILSKGDGAFSPMLFKLGTPIKLSSNEGDIEISEIEFQAKTFGDIENVLAADGLEQTIVFIRDCGTPVIVNSDKKLMCLPESAIDQISAEDGVAITNKVIPSFLG
jgi:hypothetical protein